MYVFGKMSVLLSWEYRLDLKKARTGGEQRNEKPRKEPFTSLYHTFSFFLVNTMNILRITLYLSSYLGSYSFVSSLSLFVPSASRSLSFRLLSTLDDGTTGNDIMDDADAGPSDYDPRDIFDESNESEFKQVKSLQVDMKDGDAIIREELKRELLLLASVTNRGTLANQEEQDIISDIVAQLEALNPTPEPVYQMIHDNDMSDYEHEWDLVVTNTQLFRASPFFLLVRSLLKEQSTANDLFDLYNQLTSLNKIGRVREIFYNGVLRSEIDLEVGFIKATVITQATYDSKTKNNANPETMELCITSTNIKQGNIPFMDVFPSLIGTSSFLSSSSSPMELPIGQLLKNIRGNVPKVVLKTFYIDEGLRITRDVDDNFYVFSRV